jgi:uncharacterized integral membrane protein
MRKSSHFSFWVFISLAVLLVVFSVLNSGSIYVDILFTKLEISLAILLAITFFGGIVAGALYAHVKFSHKEKEQDTITSEPIIKKDESTPYEH